MKWPTSHCSWGLEALWCSSSVWFQLPVPSDYIKRTSFASFSALLITCTVLEASPIQQGLVENGKFPAMFYWKGHRASFCCVLLQCWPWPWVQLNWEKWKSAQVANSELENGPWVEKNQFCLEFHPSVIILSVRKYRDVPLPLSTIMWVCSEDVGQHFQVIMAHLSVLQLGHFFTYKCRRIKLPFCCVL